MEKNQHKYVTVAYSLFSDNAEGVHELIEQTNEEHPLQLISGFGTMLEAFEAQIVPLNEGDKFDFTLAVDDAYGPYVAEHVIELDKQVFCIDGRFDKDNIYPGNVIPLTNADGMRFDGVIVEVKDNTVVVDLNHFLAGRALHFQGHVVQSRPATDAEIQGFLNMLSGEGCGCCGEGGCGEGGCGGHHHGEGEGGCCGHHHGEGEGCCGGHCH